MPTSLVIARDSSKGLLKNSRSEKVLEPDLFHESEPGRDGLCWSYLGKVCRVVS